MVFFFPRFGGNTHWVVDNCAQGRMCAGSRNVECSYTDVCKSSLHWDGVHRDKTKPPPGTALFLYFRVPVFCATSPQNHSLLYVVTLALRRLSCPSRCAVPSCVAFPAANMNVIDFTGFLLAAVICHLRHLCILLWLCECTCVLWTVFKCHVHMREMYLF
jgi:hypothetical protein